ncbi:MAG: sulfotransferase [Thalassovita sp.]
MPYFMIGTQRSGSNLLRVMLDQSPHIVAPHPPHFLERLSPLKPLYGDLSQSKNFARLVDDVCLLIETNPVSWSLGPLDRDYIASLCTEPSLVAVSFAVHDVLARHNHAQNWVCKSLGNVHILDEIERFGGNDAKYIHLHRDGRDVALSFKKAIVGEKTSYHIAQQWKDEQAKALAHGAKVGPDRFISVSYFGLVTQPQHELIRLCDFMDIQFQPEMLEFHRSKEAQTTSKAGQMWSNVSRPVMAGNVQNFLSDSDPANLAVFEAIAGDMLTRLGYPLVNGFNEENERLKKKALASADPDDLLKRRAQSELMAQIKHRLLNGQRDVA